MQLNEPFLNDLSKHQKTPQFAVLTSTWSLQNSSSRLIPKSSHELLYLNYACAGIYVSTSKNKTIVFPPFQVSEDEAYYPAKRWQSMYHPGPKGDFHELPYSLPTEVSSPLG